MNLSYQHLEKIKEDVRDEIKKRIEQRDKYSIQLTVVLSALVAVAFSKNGYEKVLLAAPLASIYFTVLILYSYAIHGLLARYLREEIEPLLAELAGVELQVEWENYYAQYYVPGIRKSFFLTALWVVTIASLVFLYDKTNDLTYVWATAAFLYSVACIIITLIFGKTDVVSAKRKDRCGTGQEK